MPIETTYTSTLQYRACELSIAGYRSAIIADRLGITPKLVHELVSAELDKRAAEMDRENMRLIEIERLCILLEALEEKAEAGNEQAISLTLKILHRRDCLQAPASCR